MMSFPFRQSVLTAALLCLPTACTSSPFSGTFADLAEHDLGPLTSQEQALLNSAPTPTARRSSSTGENAPTALNEFIELALKNNPRILASTQRIKRLEERIPQVTALDDPMVTIAPIGDMAQTASGEVSVMTSLSQRLPSPGKLDARGQIAQQDIAIAQAEHDRLYLAIIADTRRAWWNLYALARSIEITNANHALLTQLREIVQAKYRTGNATQESILRLTVEMHNLENELIALNQRKQSAIGMLNTLINRSVQSPIDDPQPIDLAGIDESLDDLIARATLNNPDLQAMRERMTQYRKRRDLARLSRNPDFTVGMSYNIVQDQGLSMAANGEDQWWFSFGATLPVWNDKLEAGEREATRGILESAGMLAGEQNRIAFQINDALARVESNHQQALALRDLIIPEAQQTIDVAMSGYRTGRVTFDALIDNWRKLLSLQLMYESMLANLERSVADLEESLGSRVSRSTLTSPVENKP